MTKSKVKNKNKKNLIIRYCNVHPGSIPRRRYVGVWCIQVPRRLGPPRARTAAIVAASAGSCRRSDGASLTVQRPASQLQLLPVHLLFLVTQQLVHQHARKYASKYTSHRDAEEGPQAVGQRAMYRFAMRCSFKQHPRIPFRLRCAVTRTRSNRHGNSELMIIREICFLISKKKKKTIL